MEILRPIATRRSIRRYKNTPVEEDKIHALLESARLAPSGNNSQPWNFIVIQSEDVRKKLADICHNQQWMTQAPVHIVCVADMHARLQELQKEEPGITDTSHLDVREDSSQRELKLIVRDTAIAIDHLTLQAESMGLGTCWIAWFDQESFRPVLNIPSDKYVVAVITVGYADEHPSPRPRRPLETMVYYESWGKPKN